MRNYEKLDFLASLSAIAIDSHITEQANKKNYSNVRDLSKRLRMLSNKEELNPTGLLMFAKVIWPNDEDLKGKKDCDVYPQVNLLAKDLACFEELSREKQKELRNVCLELSKKSQYYSHLYKRFVS